MKYLAPLLALLAVAGAVTGAVAWAEDKFVEQKVYELQQAEQIRQTAQVVKSLDTLVAAQENAYKQTQITRLRQALDALHRDLDKAIDPASNAYFLNRITEVQNELRKLEMVP